MKLSRLWTRPTLPEFGALVTLNLILWAALATNHLDAFGVCLRFLTLCALP